LTVTAVEYCPLTVPPGSGEAVVIDGWAFIVKAKALVAVLSWESVTSTVKW